jgi:Tol biopolymer transport system component
LATSAERRAIAIFRLASLHADVLVIGRVARRPDGRLHVVAFRLCDVATNSQLTGQQYFCSLDALRGLANIISDVIYERVTGKKAKLQSKNFTLMIGISYIRF